MRARISTCPPLAAALVVFMLCCAPAAFAAGESGPPGPAECAQVSAGGVIRFKDRNLLEIPDITEPELRRANALLSARCFDEAAQLWEDFSRRNPDDYHVLFLRARWKWIFGDAALGRVFIETVLRNHPDFASAKLLLASMDIDGGDFSAAARLLDDVERTQPEDLWAYIDRLRIEAAVAPTASTGDTVAAILHDSHFPPSARAQALHIIQLELGGLTQSERNQLVASAVEDGSVMTDCALAVQARVMIELQNDPRGGAELIERYLGKGRPCGENSPTRLRTLLAEAYLLQAAQIEPEPGTANASLVARAKDALGGDLTPVALHIASIRDLDRLIPFVRGFVDRNAVDEYGASALCAAVRAYNLPMVQEALREHADPNGNCAGSATDTVLRMILLTATRQHVTERQEMVRELLSHGARVDGMVASCQPDADCAVVLLPILQEFAERRARNRSSL